MAPRRFARVEARLRETLGPVEVEWTRGPRDAERLAREGVRAGVERIVVVGGDGTAGEVVAGLLASDLSQYCQIGLLPMGTGGDLIRSVGTSRDLDAAVEHLSRGRTRVIDAGRAVFVDRSGAERTSYYVNAASAGISGLTTEFVNLAPKHLGGRVSFLIGTLRAIGAYRFPPVRLRVDGRTVHEGPLALATACNGRYFGGGMAVAPHALLDDGLLDVVLVPGFSRARLVTRLPRLYRGTHLEEPGVVWQQARRVELEPLSGEAIWIELDGEPLGRLPARFEVLPGAVTLFGVLD